MEAGTVAERRSGQEGSRWVNERPSGEEVAKWFKENVTLPDGLKHDDYVQGVTLIVQKQKENEVVGWDDNNKPQIDERENLVYVPYVKVETRVKFFWDFVALHEEWVGAIEPVAPAKPPTAMPEGFYRMNVQQADNKVVAFVCCSMRAVIYKAGTIEHVPTRNTQTGEVQMRRKGEIIMAGAPGSKMVPTLGRYGPDVNALMKAETGAVGRALGLLGMLVVPGSGVATAEDVQEAQAMEGGPVQAAERQTGEQAKIEDSDDELRSRVTALVETLGGLDEKRLKAFRAFVKERGIGGIKDATSPQLRGLVRRLEEDIAAAQEEEAKEQEADAEGDGGDAA